MGPKFEEKPEEEIKESKKPEKPIIIIGKRTEHSETTAKIN